MTEDIRKAAIAVTAKIFETMFFIPLEVEEEGPQEGVSSTTASMFYKGEIGFQGTYSGKLVLLLSDELARTMVMNFLGLEEDEVTKEQVTDMVGELCNMTCGNLFSEFDKKTPYVLTIPKTKLFASQRMDGGAQDSGLTVDFEAEGHRVKLALEFDPPFGSKSSCIGSFQ